MDGCTALPPLSLPATTALAEWQDAMLQLRWAVLARQNMATAPNAARREVAAVACRRAADQLVDAMARLSDLPVSPEPGAKPAMRLIEDLLAAFAAAEVPPGPDGRG